MTHRKPRMGRIEYLNVLPIYHALETGRVRHGYELASAPPAVLNRMMENGELVASSTSSIEYARRPERYWVLPDLAIGSRGEVRSVLLVSRRPVADLGGQTALLTGQSHTSAALVKILLKHRARVSVNFATGNATQSMGRPDAPEAMLVIGDEALRLRNHPEYPYMWDLGEAWFAWTGLPFVFGLWVADREAAAKNALAEDPAAVLHAGRDWGAANMEAVLDAAEKTHSMTRPALKEYFSCLSYKLGEEELQGLRLFYEYLAAEGEIEKAPDIACWPGL